jgi:hypothetical protein
MIKNGDKIDQGAEQKTRTEEEEGQTEVPIEKKKKKRQKKKLIILWCSIHKDKGAY